MSRAPITGIRLKSFLKLIERTEMAECAAAGPCARPRPSRVMDSCRGLLTLIYAAVDEQFRLNTSLELLSLCRIVAGSSRRTVANRRYDAPHRNTPIDCEVFNYCVGAALTQFDV